MTGLGNMPFRHPGQGKEESSEGLCRLATQMLLTALFLLAFLYYTDWEKQNKKKTSLLQTPLERERERERESAP